MGRPRHPLVPAMPGEQAVDGAGMHGMAELAFPGLLDLRGRGNLAGGGAVEEGRKKGVFLGQGAVGMAPTAFAGVARAAGPRWL